MSKKSGADGLGARVRAARLGHDPPLTLRQLAGDRLSVAMVSRLERGEVLPSLDTLDYVASRLGVSIAALLDPAGHVRAVAATAREVGLALHRLGRPGAALEHVARAIALDPAGGGAFDRVDVLLALGRPDDAGAELAALPRDDPRTDRASGLVLLAKGQPLLAVAALRRAVAALDARTGPTASDAAPRHRVDAAELLLALGRALDASGSRETAAMTLRRAARLVSGLTTSRAYGLEVVAGSATGDVSAMQAATSLADAAWAATLDVHIRVALARVELRLGRAGDALAALEPVLQVAHSGEEGEVDSVLRELAAADVAAGRQSAASPTALSAAVHERLGHFDEAEEELRRASLAERARARPAAAAAMLLDAAVMWLRAGDRDRSLALIGEARLLLLPID